MSTPRPRKVFGRVRVTIDDAVYRSEMTRDGLTVRRQHSRHPVRMAFSTILDRTKIQFDLPLQPKLKF